MSIKPAYFRLLDHLGSTATIRELHERADAADMVGLRHDVDHDLDLALEMAHHEHARGARSTYYLLHTHAYFSSDRLVDACRQFVAYGHEVALHVNLISEWMAGAIDDLDVRIEEVLAPLRAAGIDVTGVSAHGDRMCYEHKFINYWMWRELKPADPRMSEHGLSAEGIPVSDERFRIPYPQDHQLHRADGAALPLWRCSMEDHGLRYDAAHVPVDHYWTDTGGSFTRSGDPMEHDCKAGRHQVLIHPFWWRGEKKVVFVLSTARSGSKWFANFVDRATSCRGLHEWTLNHRLAGAGSVEEKRTNTDFAGLVEDRSHAERLIEQALAHHHRLPVDVVEANVYLEAFADLLEGRERVQLVHLHRDAREVVRSILGRGWYATPYDRRHRAVDVERWDELDQFERACWYVRSVHEAIPAGAARLSFERMTQDRDYLVGWLEEMGLIVHPLLVEAAYEARLNRTERHRCPPYGQWPAEHQRVFDEICGAAQAELGYEAPGTSPGAGGARPVGFVRQPALDGASGGGFDPGAGVPAFGPARDVGAGSARASSSDGCGGRLERAPDAGGRDVGRGAGGGGISRAGGPHVSLPDRGARAGGVRLPGVRALVRRGGGEGGPGARSHDPVGYGGDDGGVQRAGGGDARRVGVAPGGSASGPHAPGDGCVSEIASSGRLSRSIS